MITDIQKAIAGEKLDGWLFFNFLHRDPVSDRILNLDQYRINSRPWYYLVPAEGKPVRICHAVEPGSLEALPGTLHIYNNRESLSDLLSGYTEKFGVKWGAQYSRELTTVSTLDYGTALLLEDAGMKLYSSAGLIQRLSGLLDADGIKSHEDASAELYDIVSIVWSRIIEHFTSVKESSKPLLERDIQQLILDEFEVRNMITEHLPIVACGVNSGNPHYAPEEHNNPITADSVLQLDIWAKFDRPGSIFADISWLGWTGSAVPDKIETMFSAVTAARDRCAAFIDEKLASGDEVSGFDADRETRKVLIENGYEELIKHRTGHGIDVNVHGSGAGLDSVEFPDRRLLLEGSCFSIEPGLYSPAFGMRTEIDAYIRDGRLIISGPGPQTEILTIQN
ncbi:MAG: M24 family metallopeptidase [Spirochaetales bacterium]|uniref:M24 family metallopeptidase n=1 Tax=Candidatus Thalassospirochaeta sargassi TaxID=3119039 RepID=A0AAJ1III5_9SPIO|nr:M24 family metallopeptidase [Spirochaetales bacterium]